MLQWNPRMRHVLLLAVLLCSAPALAQRGAINGTTGAVASRAATTSPATTTDWRWMTSGIRAGEALWRNFWRRDHTGATQRVRASAFPRGQLGWQGRTGTPDILTGTSQRIDILTGRPID
jgi:hypothetical protein